MQRIGLTQLDSDYGKIMLIWRKSNLPKIIRIYLPNNIAENIWKEKYKDAEFDSHPRIESTSRGITRFLNGDDVKFDLSVIDISTCREFQRSVLQAEYLIPRGWVSTYGRIAKTLDNPKGGRAVGYALSNNPFPIIIPCHRAILSDRRLGGFQGGVKMKMDLLKKEGIEFSSSGRVITNRICY
ncbi:MAG: methylated-DNA-[protein]-cysteine S-methyltransferase [Thermoproteota archaeon]|nr:methylated-DNA-[protein]-cysteine S-methyltransferase [Thermoproteota archaeon]